MKVQRIAKFASVACLCGLMIVTVGASPPQGKKHQKQEQTLAENLGIIAENLETIPGNLVRTDPSADMVAHDAAVLGIVSEAPFAHVTKNLAPASHGERLESGATTDVWVLGQFAYTGTFSTPCGGEDNAGIFIWDVHNPEDATKAGFIESPDGSRTNDVKVATMNSGDILVHSNETCGADGVGGFEIYDVNDPNNPEPLAHVQTDDINPLLRNELGFVDFGVHNLFLFSQGDKDYVAATVESEFGNFQIFDITDPRSPTLVGFWGAESLFLPDVDFSTTDDFGLILDTDAYLFGGFGASQNRFLHDFTISKDGNRAYLANWDAGLVLLDISDVTSPSLVSVALDPDNGSLDGEVNSHSAWPSEDGTIVVEGEEDFSAWERNAPPGNLTFGEHPENRIPGTAISTAAGDDFEAIQTGNSGTVKGSSLVIESGKSYPAVELSGNQPRFTEVGIKGNMVWIGRACDGDALENPLSPGDIAIVRRGACTFADKLDNAASNGAAAVVISNNLQVSTPWSGLRIWSYADPANPVLASIFNTECSASTAPSDNCDARGTFSSHNVIVETSGDTVKAYISWYTDGVVVIDVTDPFNPVETARYYRAGPEFEDENGGIQDIWGIYKVEGSPWIYASDRNGGLYVLKEYGAGSEKQGKQ